MRSILSIACGAMLVLLAATRPAAQAGEDLARRQFESGLSFVQNGRYAEAIKDFQAVVDSFPQTRVADDALLQIALYHLDVSGDLAAAQATTDRLLKEYPASDSAPMGYVLTGRLTVARSRAAADIEAALASYERVPRLFPASSAVAAARFHAGETLRSVRRIDEAMQQYRRVSLEYPRSIWAARADLAATSALVAADRPLQAFGRLQRIRQEFPNSPEAAAALNFNTLLYRLYVRKPVPYTFSGRFLGTERDRFRDVTGVVFDGSGRVLLGHRQGVTVFDPKGAVVRQLAAPEASAFFVDGRDRIVTVRRDTFLPEGGAALVINVPVPGKVARQPEEIPAVISLSGGDRIFIDRKARNVVRLTSAGRFVATFAAVNAERLARSDIDDVAIIDRETKSVLVVDRDGKTLGRIPAKGQNYQLEEPVDVAYDSAGHLYVLDGRKATVLVFNGRQRLVATLASTGKEAGSLQKPQALAVDAAGRLYVFDENTQRIQVYQ